MVLIKHAQTVCEYSILYTLYTTVKRFGSTQIKKKRIIVDKISIEKNLFYCYSYEFYLYQSILEENITVSTKI